MIKRKKPSLLLTPYKPIDQAATTVNKRNDEGILDCYRSGPPARSAALPDRSPCEVLAGGGRPALSRQLLPSCHIPAGSPLLPGLHAVHAALSSHPILSKRIHLLPTSSWHMTVLDGVREEECEPGMWPPGKEKQLLRRMYGRI